METNDQKGSEADFIATSDEAIMLEAEKDSEVSEGARVRD